MSAPVVTRGDCGGAEVQVVHEPSTHVCVRFDLGGGRVFALRLGSEDDVAGLIMALSIAGQKAWPSGGLA